LQTRVSVLWLALTASHFIILVCHELLKAQPVTCSDVNPFFREVIFLLKAFSWSFLYWPTTDSRLKKYDSVMAEFQIATQNYSRKA